MSINLLTPGEKLRKIRTEYKIRQHEICGDHITRNMISMIETNKAGLTDKTAEILFNNIASICADKGLSFEYSLSFLTTSPESEARVHIKNYIDDLDINNEIIFEDDFIHKLKDYNYLINKYNLKYEKTELYSRIGNILFHRRNMHGAYTYYLRTLDTFSGSFADSELIDILSKLIICCNNLDKYEESVNYWSLLKGFDDLDYETEYTILYNVFTSYRALNDFDNVMGILSKLELLTSKEENRNYELNGIGDDYSYIIIEKGLYLLEQKKYTDSLNTYKNLLEKNNLSHIYKIITLCYLTTIYLHLKDKKNLEFYLEKLLLSIKGNVIYDRNLLGQHLPTLYSSIAKAFMYLEKYNQCFEYLQRSLNVSKSLNATDFIEDSITDLFKVSISMDNKDIIDEVKTLYLELISNNQIDANNPVIFSLIKYYNDIRDSDTISQLLDFSPTNVG